MDNFVQLTKTQILEAVASGMISGKVSEWPQVKEACEWAVFELARLREVAEAAGEYVKQSEKMFSDMDSGYGDHIAHGGKGDERTENALGAFNKLWEAVDRWQKGGEG